MSWQDEFNSKLVSADVVAAEIKSGDRIYCTGGGSFPFIITEALEKRMDELEDVWINHVAKYKPVKFHNPEFAGHIMTTNPFMGPIERRGLLNGTIQPNICSYWQEGFRLREVFKPTVTLMGASMPDENGRMCLIGPYNAKIAMETSRLKAVTVNRNQPYVFGNENSYVTADEVDYIIEDHRDVNTYSKSVSPDDIPELERKIASYIIPYVEDGSCVQLGVGNIADAVGFSLKDHKHLGVYTELLTPAFMYLVKQGAVDCSRKEYEPGKISTAMLQVGSSQEYRDWIHRNDMIRLHILHELNDPRNIAQNSNFVSINNCMAVDLTGQVNSETIGTKMYGGQGGQVDFVRGAGMSKNGKSFLCLKSTFEDKDGSVKSTITSTLPLGSAVTVARADVQYIVTEYGIADLKFRNLKERVEALVAIAHPDFREQLMREAYELRIIY